MQDFAPRDADEVMLSALNDLGPEAYDDAPYAAEEAEPATDAPDELPAAETPAPTDDDADPVKELEKLRRQAASYGGQLLNLQRQAKREIEAREARIRELETSHQARESAERERLEAAIRQAGLSEDEAAYARDRFDVEQEKARLGRERAQREALSRVEQEDTQEQQQQLRLAALAESTRQALPEYAQQVARQTGVDPQVVLSYIERPEVQRRALSAAMHSEESAIAFGQELLGTFAHFAQSSFGRAEGQAQQARHSAAQAGTYRREGAPGGGRTAADLGKFKDSGDTFGMLRALSGGR